MAMLVVLESLTPDERAVFVLREVFGFSHAEIGAALGQAGCRRSGALMGVSMSKVRLRFEVETVVEARQNRAMAHHCGAPSVRIIWAIVLVLSLDFGLIVNVVDTG